MTKDEFDAINCEAGDFLPIVLRNGHTGLITGWGLETVDVTVDAELAASAERPAIPYADLIDCGGRLLVQAGFVGLRNSPARLPPGMAFEPMTRADLALRDGRAADIGQELIAECDRQVSVEGYTPKHDERHFPSEFARAAAAYALYAAAGDGAPMMPEVMRAHAAAWWPWGAESFKPKDIRRDLVRAGALTIRAIERIDREAIRDAEVDAQ